MAKAEMQEQTERSLLRSSWRINWVLLLFTKGGPHARSAESVCIEWIICWIIYLNVVCNIIICQGNSCANFRDRKCLSDVDKYYLFSHESVTFFFLSRRTACRRRPISGAALAHKPRKQSTSEGPDEEEVENKNKTLSFVMTFHGNYSSLACHVGLVTRHLVILSRCDNTWFRFCSCSVGHFQGSLSHGMFIRRF